RSSDRRAPRRAPSVFSRRPPRTSKIQARATTMGKPAANATTTYESTPSGQWSPCITGSTICRTANAATPYATNARKTRRRFSSAMRGRDIRPPGRTWRRYQKMGGARLPPAVRAVRAAAMPVELARVPGGEGADRTAGADNHVDLRPGHDPAADRVRKMGVRYHHPAWPSAAIDVAARRQRGPAGVAVGPTPGHPGRSPDVSGYPVPSEPRAPAPAAVMIGGPAPGNRRCERPAPTRAHPLPVRVRLPVGSHVRGDPDAPVFRRVDPTPIRRKLLLERPLIRSLRRRLCGGRRRRLHAVVGGRRRRLVRCRIFLRDRGAGRAGQSGDEREDQGRAEGVHAHWMVTLGGDSSKRAGDGRCITASMFTGLIEDVGTVTAVDRVPKGARLSVRTRLSGLPRGASIAVDGACLTAVDFSGDRLTADLSAETLEKTTLG